MTLQRRLLLLLLVGVPLIWVISLGVAIVHARAEINELFDTQEVRLAQQVMSLLPHGESRTPPALRGDSGEADLETMAVSVWIDGQRVAFDREGAAIPYQPGVAGFAMPHIERDRWRIFYLPSADGRRVVAVGQSASSHRFALC